MDIAQVQAFIEAERRGSFRKAAKAMFLSQPSLSSRIRMLEKELGAELFHRRGSGVVLTDMGRVFLPYARRAMESLGEARQVVATAQNAAGGIVTIAATRQVGNVHAPGNTWPTEGRTPGCRGERYGVQAESGTPDGCRRAGPAWPLPGDWCTLRWTPAGCLTRIWC